MLKGPSLNVVDRLNVKFLTPPVGINHDLNHEPPNSIDCTSFGIFRQAIPSDVLVYGKPVSLVQGLQKTRSLSITLDYPQQDIPLEE